MTIDHLNYRATGRTAAIVAVMTDGTECERVAGKVVLSDKGIHMLDCGARHVVVKPWRDGTVHSWSENSSRDDAMRTWLDAVMR